MHAWLVGVHLQHAPTVRMDHACGKRAALFGALRKAEVIVEALAHGFGHCRAEFARYAQIVWCAADADELATRNRIGIGVGNLICIDAHYVAIDFLVPGCLLERGAMNYFLHN